MTDGTVTEFTPLISLIGGLMIGASAVLLMLLRGRVFGATGILAGFMSPQGSSDWAWRAALLFGMATGPIAYLIVTGEMPDIQVPVSTGALIVGGFIVGIGVTYGSGCTSGHGVCGMARLSPRSIVATLSFMVSTAVTVFVIRHVIGGV
ncbi:YeeE/YedE family protein [Celeribacter litoreus]|uniref:YeeE/YedE family protein n=1 Tax=Celeribacter litoreus TaxID=2876714 RepID=UPI001CCF7135|nr:YeeE/YedE thiosulfate transporter family protein [Celeribacter litoreus]MCA0043636.1 YeeE/YedE family protein [Celeribacter litoreus]